MPARARAIVKSLGDIADKLVPRVRPQNGSSGGEEKKSRLRGEVTDVASVAHPGRHHRRRRRTLPSKQQVASPERTSAAADPFAELKTRVHREIIPRLGPRLFNARDQPTSDLEAKVNEVVTELLAVEKTPLTRQERQEIISQITDDILGYGPLEPFLRDDSITEVMVNDHKTIYIERHGKITRTNAQFVDEPHLLRIIDKIISRIGRRIDESSPYVDARLPDGSRVNAIIPPLAVRGSTLTIRKFRRDPFTMADLIKFGTLTHKSGPVPGGVRPRQAEHPDLGRYRLR